MVHLIIAQVVGCTWVCTIVNCYLSIFSTLLTIGVNFSNFLYFIPIKLAIQIGKVKFNCVTKNTIVRYLQVFNYALRQKHLNSINNKETKNTFSQPAVKVSWFNIWNFGVPESRPNVMKSSPLCMHLHNMAILITRPPHYALSACKT